MSLISLFAFLNMAIYILLSFRSSFPLYFTIFVVTVFVLPAIYLFLELTGYREKSWKFWQSLPILGHMSLCALCLLWIGYLLPKALLPAIRKEYEKN